MSGGGGGLGASVGGMIGGLLGQGASQGDRDQSKAAADRAYQELMSIGLPPDLAKPLVLKELQKQGVLTPELQQYVAAGPSKVSQIQEDPSLRKAQTNALQMLSQRASGGLNAEDRSNLNKIRDENARDEQSKQQQILMNMQQRGMGGAGAELAQSIAASQSSANRASREGDDLAATASRNALEAARQYGSMAGQLRIQDFDVNKEKSAAEDLTNRFNVQNRQNVNNANSASKNRAQEYNLNENQRISDSNASLSNNEQLRQNKEKANYYSNMLNRAGMRSGAEQNMSNEYGKRAQNVIDQSTRIGAGLGQIGEAAFSGMSGTPSTGVLPGSNNMSSYSPDELDYNDYENKNKGRGGPF